MRPMLVALAPAFQAACLFLAACLASAGGAATAAPTLQVHSSAIGTDGRFSDRQSAYGLGLSPPIAWSGVPGAASYAVILDDPDASGPSPFVHWLIWNIPAGTTSLAEGLPRTGRLAAPAGAEQGRNGAGGTGYFGPRPPSGVHHYSLRVFALDRRLAVSPGADRATLAAALNGHVLAVGTLRAAYAAPGGR